LCCLPRRQGGVQSSIVGIVNREILSVRQTLIAYRAKVTQTFLFKFGGYVEWPEGVFPHKDSPLIIGVAGAYVLAAELSQVVAGTQTVAKIGL